MGFPFDFIGEDAMTELVNSANKVTLLQRTGGFGTSSPTLTKAANGTAAKSNTGGEIFGVQPLVSSVGVAIGGSVIDLELLKGGSDMPKPAQGSFTVQGDIIVNASARNGMELLHRNITQDRNPTVAYAGGGSFPSAHTVVATAALKGTQGTHTVVTIPNAIKYEVEPTVTLSGTVALAANSVEGIVEITGTDRNGVTIVRNARWNSGNLTTTSQKVGGFFKTITKVTSEGFATTGNLTVTVTDKATKMTFTPYDSAIVDYLDMELDLGNLVPFGFFSGVTNGVSFNFARDEAVQYTLSCLFGQVNIRKSITGGDSVPTIPSTVSEAVAEVFIGTQCEVEVEGTVMPLETAAMTLSQNFIPSPYIGKTIWPKKPRRSGYRSVDLNLTFPATQQNNWLQYFQGHAEFKDVIVRARNGVTGTNGQFGGQIDWHFNDMVLGEAPTISTAGQDVASQTATLRAFSNTKNSAFKIFTIQDDYERLYRYA